MRQNEMIEIGLINHLEAARESDHGIYFEATNGQEVLLPNIYAEELEPKLGEIYPLFVYTDSEDRPVATTLRPYAQRGEFAYLEVVDYRQYGAFVDWGLPKDLFVPLGEQKEYFHIQKRYVLYLLLDEQTNRLYATQKIGKHLKRDLSDCKKGQSVELMVLAKTPMGFKVIVENSYEGMLFDNEIFCELKVGMKIDGYIKKIRGDGKLDCTLQQPNTQARALQEQEKILAYIGQTNAIKLHTKLDPLVIKQELNMSKKAFKAAFNQLLQEKKIALDDKGAAKRV